MGDQVGVAVAGRLCYIPAEGFERVVRFVGDKHGRAALFADMCRLNALYMIARAGSGHIGSSFSSLDIVSWLLLEELDPLQSPPRTADVFFSSKGHDAPGYYAALIGLGRLPFALLHRLRRGDGLPGHPDVGTPGIVTNTGSLGMGISKAKGMILANRLLGRNGRAWVMTGDGELQEGQIWESLLSAANRGLHELCVIVDHNKLQSDTYVRNVSDLGDLEAKFRSFGWWVERCDGHDPRALAQSIRTLSRQGDHPKVLIADTVKGRGVSFMEHTALDSDVAMYRFHSGAPDVAAYREAAGEILARIGQRARKLGLEILPQEIERDPPAASLSTAKTPQRLVAAYGRALLEQAERHPNLVALDADLVLDTGLIPFRDRFPDRLIECGIAEQDMVSMAGGMALRGALPVVHSFACFLSSRPNEQVYNNATERTKVIYVGSLAGLLPGGPGHSHQAVRDIASLAGIPGMVMVEPSCEAEVALLLEYCIERHPGASYIRLVSLPWDIPFTIPAGYQLEVGKGVALCEGDDALIIGAGPIVLSEAFRAARQLREERSWGVAVVNLPWLNLIDKPWLSELAGRFRHVFTLDNHYLDGGQGDCICSALLAHPPRTIPRLHRFGVRGIPTCGSNAEVLRAHDMDSAAIAREVVAALTSV